MAAIEADSNIQVKNLIKMALYAGIRRGELFKLQWDDIGFDRGFIRIRGPKGGIDQHIPLSDSARAVLESPGYEEMSICVPRPKGNNIFLLKKESTGLKPMPDCQSIFVRSMVYVMFMRRS